MHVALAISQFGVSARMLTTVLVQSAGLVQRGGRVKSLPTLMPGMLNMPPAPALARAGCPPLTAAEPAPPWPASAPAPPDALFPPLPAAPPEPAAACGAGVRATPPAPALACAAAAGRAATGATLGASLPALA